MTYPSQTIVDPKLLDLAIAELQTAIKSNVDWFDNVYGLASIMQTGEGRAQSEVYSIFAEGESFGGLESVDLSPSDNLGCYCFFYATDHKFKGWHQGAISSTIKRTASVALIAFWDYDKAYPGEPGKTVMHVIDDLSSALLSVITDGIKISVLSSSERLSEVWRPVRLVNTDNVVTRRPYGYCRLDLEVVYDPKRISCYKSINSAC